MKLWEALEKSNKVRRKGWDEDYYVEFTPDDRILKQGKEEANYIPSRHFKADDWELYNEPVTDDLQNQIDKLMAKVEMLSLSDQCQNDKIAKLEIIQGQQQKQINESNIALGDKLTLAATLNGMRVSINRLEKAQIEHEREIVELKLIAHDHRVNVIEKPVVR